MASGKPLKSIDKGSTGKRSADEDAAASKRPKISFGLSSAPKTAVGNPTKGKVPGGLQIKLLAPKSSNITPLSNKNSAVFNDSDEEPEEMPPEARMKMRNIGRDTPTSAGPNSFGKTKQGFCNVKKVFEKSLKEGSDDEDK